MSLLHEGDEWVSFSRQTQIFRLKAGNTLYAFCISEGVLEHLYWGPYLDGDFDLRYLCKQEKAAPFDPKQERSHDQIHPIKEMAQMLKSHDAEEVQKTWSQYRGALGPVSLRKAGGGQEDAHHLYARRMGALSFAKTSIIVLATNPRNSHTPTRADNRHGHRRCMHDKPAYLLRMAGRVRGA